MPDLLKKTLLAGVGLALKAWDEVEDLAREVAKEGRMSEKEGRKFLQDIQKKYEDTQKKLEERVEKSVKEFLKKADVATRTDLRALKKEIRDLKTMIGNESENKS
jgi:polyhydroxyalkanoate synthesis regulator phasin